MEGRSFLRDPMHCPDISPRAALVNVVDFYIRVLKSGTNGYESGGVLDGGGQTFRIFEARPPKVS
jgi:hypothetical protein